MATWLLDRVPADQHAALGDRLPVVRLLLAAQEQRRPLTPEWVMRMLECSRATAYRVLAGMRKAGFTVVRRPSPGLPAREVQQLHPDRAGTRAGDSTSAPYATASRDRRAHDGVRVPHPAQVAS
ncbi:hypothetical protein CO641_02285 [Lysobacteraceae bacterium NML91-0213]|nr:hypothetical protein CO641_02285 [Xanthomonadaceae bacterium NML91-0213]